MWKLSAIAMVAAAIAAQSPKYGVGRPATPEEIRALDGSVAPNGDGLPKGSGTAAAGKEVYAAKCANCHGQEGEGGIGGPLAGGIGTLGTAKPVKTVGSYWPYATTLWDYTHRAMPFERPGQLSASEVYSVVAYVLYLNGIVGKEQVMDAKSLPKVKMPNRDGFVADPRPDVAKKARTKR